MVEVTTARIANASSVELVIITYELLLNEIEMTKKYLIEEDENKIYKHLDKAKSYLKELTYSLDMQYPLSLDIMSLYLYINKNLIYFSIKKDQKLLDDSDRILNILLNGWKEIEKNTDNKAIMNNTEMIYSGFTYGKSGLNDTIMNDYNRGIKV